MFIKIRKTLLAFHFMFWIKFRHSISPENESNFRYSDFIFNFDMVPTNHQKFIEHTLALSQTFTALSYKHNKRDEDNVNLYCFHTFLIGLLRHGSRAKETELSGKW